MHSPQSNTQSLSILSFEESRLEAAGRDRPDYDRDAWLYIPDHYEEYRYILGTRGQRPLICLGVNPSTAAPGALDNTLKSVERIAHHNGFDSFVMLMSMPSGLPVRTIWTGHAMNGCTGKTCRLFAMS